MSGHICKCINNTTHPTLFPPGTGEKRTRQAHDTADKKRGQAETATPTAKKKKVKTVDVDLPDAPPDGRSRFNFLGQRHILILFACEPIGNIIDVIFFRKAAS